MKRKLYLLAALMISAGTMIAQPLPGSGNAVTFSGAAGTNYITIPHILGRNDYTTGLFTIDLWIRVPPNQVDLATADNDILCKWPPAFTPNPYSYALRVLNSGAGSDAGKLIFLRYDGATSKTITSINALNDNRWHHVAISRTGPGTPRTFTFYIDGISQGNFVDFTANVDNSSNVLIGARSNGANRFTGSVDELRFWNTGLTQGEIRDRMCRKIRSTDALVSNLISYYKFDESSGNVAIDSLTGVRNNGTLPGTANVTRTLSGAPIGDFSAHDYVNTTKTVTLNPSTGNSFTATSTSGSPAGMHIYYTNALPNTTSGASGVGTNRHYFGVHQAGGTNQQYTAVYNYTGNTYVTVANESLLKLYKRADNAATVWTDAVATANVSNKTLTVTGQSTEYILGNASAVALPIKILFFDASIQGQSDVHLNWTAAYDRATSVKFEVERSYNALDFQHITTVDASDETSTKTYSFTDRNASEKVGYYRLKAVESDGKITYSSIIKVHTDRPQTGLLSVFPNPANDYILINGIKRGFSFTITDMMGKKVLQGTAGDEAVLRIDISKLVSGTYLLQYLADDTRKPIKFRVASAD
jgi:hypothetical protein